MKSAAVAAQSRIEARGAGRAQFTGETMKNHEGAC
jgi:hypothetical protein